MQRSGRGWLRPGPRPCRSTAPGALAPPGCRSPGGAPGDAHSAAHVTRWGAGLGAGAGDELSCTGTGGRWVRCAGAAGWWRCGALLRLWAGRSLLVNHVQSSCRTQLLRTGQPGDASPGARSLGRVSSIVLTAAAGKGRESVQGLIWTFFDGSKHARRTWCVLHGPGQGQGNALDRAERGCVPRSIGDHDLKPVGVVAEPEVHSLFVGQEEQFLILASDGLWECMSDERAVSYVQARHPQGVCNISCVRVSQAGVTLHRCMLCAP